MKIERVKADLLEHPDVNIILHQANCFCRMGSGFAANLCNKYPQAREADNKTEPGDVSKLGKFTVAYTHDNKRIVNLYSQYDYGATKCHTNYNALYDGLVMLRDAILASDKADQYVLGLPYKMASGLAGGSWVVVEAIIKDVFEESPLRIIICEKTE